MEFHQKLQELRKQRGLTQEELAESLYVSRTAVSKWESGRGYPSLDSLKAIAAFYSVTIDQLLSTDEVFNLAEQESQQKGSHFRDLLYALLDLSTALLLFLPFFRQQNNSLIEAVSLLDLTEIRPYLKGTFLVLIIASVLCGILTLALQNVHKTFWLHNKSKLSLLLSFLLVLLFMISRQAYAGTFTFVFLSIKIFFLLKQQ